MEISRAARCWKSISMFMLLIFLLRHVTHTLSHTHSATSTSTTKLIRRSELLRKRTRPLFVSLRCVVQLLSHTHTHTPSCFCFSACYRSSLPLSLPPSLSHLPLFSLKLFFSAHLHNPILFPVGCVHVR